MATSGNLRLPQSPRAAVFRTLVDQLRASVPLKQAGLRWRVWDGSPGVDQPWGLGMTPGARLTPQGEAASFMSPDAYLSNLTIGVEIAVASLHLDDAENLFWAFVRALWPEPRAERLALMEARRDAGARTGLIQFGGVSYETIPTTNPPILVISFSLSIEVSLVINP